MSGPNLIERRGPFRERTRGKVPGGYPVPNQAPVRSSLRRNLPDAFLLGFTLLEDEADQNTRRESIAEAELMLMFVNALTDSRQGLIQEKLGGNTQGEFVPKAGFDFPEHDADHQVRKTESGALLTFHVDLAVPVNFVAAALARDGQDSQAVALIDNATTPTVLRPDQSASIVIAFAHQLSKSEFTDQGPDTNLRESTRVWGEIARGRAFRLPHLL